MITPSFRTGGNNYTNIKTKDMKRVKDYSLTEVEKLLSTNMLRETLAIVAEKRFGIPSANNKTKKQLRELINASVEHEKSMAVIKEVASLQKRLDR